MTGNEGFKALIYAVRLTVLARLGGKLALVLAVLCVPSILVALLYGEFQYLMPLGLIILPLLGVAWFTRHLPDPSQMLRTEGFVLTCTAFILTPLLLSLALLPSGIHWLDLVFETVSAVTTTGLSTLTQIHALDKTVLFTRSWMQWYGGLGIVVLSVTLLMQRSLAVFQLLDAPEGQGFVFAATVYARRILQVYVVLSLLAILLCWLSFEDFFTGVVHGLSAISTGGFSSRDESLMGLSLLAQMGVILPSVAGAISLAIYLRVQHKAWKQILDNDELRHFLWLMLGVCVALALVQMVETGFSLSRVADLTLLGLSAISSTGFANLDVGHLTAGAKLVLMFAMFVGGCLGSTAGGFKVFRLMVVWQLLLNTLRRASASSHTLIEPRIQGKVLTQDQIQVAMLIGSLLMALITLSWLPFLIYGHEPLAALFEVVSAVGTVGLSAGITGPDLPAPLKIVLCIDMVAGRVEIIALLCLLYPGVWFGHRNSSA